MTSSRTPAEIMRQRRVMRGLARLYPGAATALQHCNPFELLVATILSAQANDKTINEITPALFKKYPHAPALAAAAPAELEKLILRSGFFRSKAKNLLGCAQALVQHHGGQVPQTMAELVALPGVGRKTANVVLGNAFGKNEGVVVDTHVRRLSQRLGFTSHTLPEKIEQDLIKIVPKKTWTIFSHQLILHGRQICQARKPKCPDCLLAPDCPAGQIFLRKI